VAASGQLREWLDRLAALGGVVSALEAIVATPDDLVFRHAAGFRVGGERLVAGAGARFDAASLTKPWAATLALALDGGRGDRRLSLSETAESEPSPALDDLLRHRAGMPAWVPLALRLGKRLGDRRELLSFLRSLLGGRGAGATGQPVYSDLGYLLWGLIAEERLREPWTSALDRIVCAPLGLAPLGALAGEPPLPVECRLDNGKEVELAREQGFELTPRRSFLRGTVQDGNARALVAAGIAPAHAGLFVTADELLALGREWLRPGRLLRPEQVAAALGGGGDDTLGWARAREGGSSGPALSRAAFGHTGFTGGSVWIDPERERIYLLLAHRLASAIDFQPFRREFHRFGARL
jgi:CubicO group peptidase (beta-lactamase class C family)